MEMADTDKLDVVFVDDQEVIREAFGMLISNEPTVNLVGTLGDGEEAIHMVPVLNPSVVVMDVKMPGLNGIAAAQQIREKDPDVGIILLSAYDDSDYIREFLKDDPKGKAYLLKHTLGTMDELIRTIHDVAAGRTVLDPIMVEKLTAQKGIPETSPLRDLTKRDKDKVLVAYRHGQPDLLFEKPIGVRDTLLVNGRKMKIVGTLGQIGNPDDDSAVWLPLETARDVLDEPEGFDVVIAQTHKGLDPNRVAESVKKELRKSRDVKEDEEDFTVSTSESLLETFGEVFAIATVVLIGLAAISLFVGGVGIMNTMFTSVLHRTKEIGVMKATGATNSDIAYLFLVESGIIGLIGGTVGIALGMGVSKLVEFAATQAGITFFKASFPLYLILGSLAFSFIVGMISGVLPALQAAKLQPVEALRYE